MSDTKNPFDEWAQTWTQMWSNYADSSQWWMGGENQQGDAREVMKKMTESHLKIVGSGARYMGGWATLSARAHTLAVQAMTLSTSEDADRGEELGRLTDELRKTYRELADLPAQESQQLQVELAAIWNAPSDFMRRAPAKT